jgi:hypothetical protein
MVIDVVDEINGSGIPRATKANALALLALAHPDNGHVSITWEDLARAFGHISISRARKHMAIMQACDLIHYSSNSGGVLYINFAAWVRGKRLPDARKTTTPRAKNDHGARDPEPEVDDVEQLSDHPTREKRPSHARKTTTGRAKNDHDLYASAQASLLVSSSDPIPSEEEELTNKQTPPEPWRLPWEAPLSYRLLTDKRVALGPKIAERLAKAHRFGDVRDAVAHWYCNRKSAGGKFEDTAGIVIRWLEEPDQFTIPLACDDFLHSDLAHDYRTPEELTAAAAAATEASQAQPPAADPAPAEPEPGTPAAHWQQIVGELATEQGGSFGRWVHDTQLVNWEEETNTYTIGLPDAFRYDWIVNRLSKQINRKLQVITGRKASTEFIVTNPGTVSRETQGDHT